MEEERDVIIVEDEEGQELSLEVIDYFLYDGVEYHVDLLACNEIGEFTAMLPEEMTAHVQWYL